MSATRIYATGFDHVVGEDRPTLHVSSGAGNHGGFGVSRHQIHLSFTDVIDGCGGCSGDDQCGTHVEVQGWFNIAELIEAIKKEAGLA